MAKPTFFRHHEPLPTPAKWGDEERMFAVKLEHTLDDIYQRFGKIRLKDLAPDVQEEFKDIIDMVDGLDTKLLNKVYPVGSIYTSVNATSPAALFGGTWERLKSRFLLGADDSTYVNEATGGAATINLEHNHTTGDHKLTAAESGNPKLNITGGGHTHPVSLPHDQSGNGVTIPANSNYLVWNTGTKWAGSALSNKNATSGFSAASTTHTHTVAAAAASSAHNHGNTGNKLSKTQSIMPPYLVVYMWKRTA